tara:strand:+ start:9466 stop:9984 length:519 start_codon:yes stop_codon:yes gene_type:complete
MVNFREAVFNDYKQIAALHVKSWQQNYRKDFSDHFLDNEAFQDRLVVWENRLKNPLPNQYVIVAEMEGVMVGFSCAFFDENSTYGTLLDNLHVVSEAKGMGVGTKLIRFIAKQSLAYNNKSGIYLWVLENNRSAIEFYKYLGGKHTETVTGQDIGDRKVQKCRIVWNSAADL